MFGRSRDDGLRWASSDRSFRGFLEAVREEPGSCFRVLAVFCAAASLALSRGVLYMVVTLLAALPLGIGLGYPFFRRRGRLPGSRR
jgi:hypothetical protein